MNKVIAIATCTVFFLTLGCSTNESISMPEEKVSTQTSSREKARDPWRQHHLEIIYYGEGRWPNNYVNLSAEEKLKIQVEHMDRIRNGKNPMPIPLTKEQVDQLEKEGHFSSISINKKIKRSFSE